MSEETNEGEYIVQTVLNGLKIDPDNFNSETWAEDFSKFIINEIEQLNLSTQALIDAVREEGGWGEEVMNAMEAINPESFKTWINN